MANDLMIPESGIPAHILALGAAAAAADNADALGGVSTGMPPRIKINGTKFALVSADGTELPFPASKLVIGPDENQYMPIVVLKAKPALSKQFYLKKYNKDEEGASPDCWSEDGQRPAVGVVAPISEVCANCPKNAFGSGTDQDGNPTKGKACSDNKVLATFVPGFGVFALKIPPASLKNWGGFVKKLTSANIPVTAIKTFVGFEPTSSSPVLVFQFGGFVDEKAMPKLQAMAASPEVLEIIGGTAPTQKALPASQEVIDQPAEDEAKKNAVAAAAKKKADAAAKKKKADEAAAAALAAKTPPPGDDLDLDMSFDSGDTAPPVDAGGTSDDELAAALGL